MVRDACNHKTFTAFLSNPFSSFKALDDFMYRRSTLYPLEIAVDFLKSLYIAVVWGGGVVLGYKVIYYIPIDDGMKQVLGRAGGI